MKKTLVLLSLCLAFAGLTACGGPAPASTPAPTSAASPLPAQVASPPVALAAEGLVAIQNDFGGLQDLPWDNNYGMVLIGEPNYDNPALENYALARIDGNGGIETVLIENLTSYAAVFRTSDGTLYYNDFETAIYILDEEAKTLTLFSDGDGHTFGPRWFTDGAYIYTTYHPLTNNPKDNDYGFVRVSLADGSKQVMEGVRSIFPVDAFGSTFLYEWELEKAGWTMFSFDCYTGEHQSLGELDEAYIDLRRGVAYRYEIVGNTTVMEGLNLLTGKTGTATLDIACETWFMGYIEDKQLPMEAYVDGQNQQWYINLATGEVTR